MGELEGKTCNPEPSHPTTSANNTTAPNTSPEHPALPIKSNPQNTAPNRTRQTAPHENLLEHTESATPWPRRIHRRIRTNPNWILHSRRNHPTDRSAIRLLRRRIRRLLPRTLGILLTSNPTCPAEPRTHNLRKISKKPRQTPPRTCRTSRIHRSR